jgi:hypothetical protein
MKGLLLPPRVTTEGYGTINAITSFTYKTMHADVLFIYKNIGCQTTSSKSPQSNFYMRRLRVRVIERVAWALDWRLRNSVASRS